MQSTAELIDNHNEANDNDIPRLDQYKIVDHISHIVGIAVSTFYLIAALATLIEVFSRYVLNKPTYWAFETVMVSVAAAWMLSAGYVTLKKRHISITVIHNIASPSVRWWLDLFAMLIGVFALYMLLSDASIRSYLSIERLEKSGSAFNSPLPMMMKFLMVVGAFMYLAQLLLNLHRHVRSNLAKTLVKLFAAYAFVYFLAGILGHGFGIEIFSGFTDAISDIGKSLDPSKTLQLRKMDLGTISIIMVVLLIALMMTGMPLGIVTLFVSVIMAIGFFGPRGLFLVSSNAAGLLEHYSLVAVPFLS